MGRRDDRLRDPTVFRAALMSRAVARNEAFAVYRVVTDAGFRLGFVIPKKLVKTSVQRNQIKRWARAIFRAFEAPQPKAEAWVLRVSQPFPKSAWLASGRGQARQNIYQVMESAFRK
jgi:ribonuclease P protein component